MKRSASEQLAWRVHREAVLLLAGPRALLLQIAHPAIAAGVRDHSDWQHRPYRRLFRTLWLINQIVLGRDVIAARAVRHVNRRHANVNGHYKSGVSYSPTPYHANHPDLQMWVLATLIDSSIDAYKRWIAPLSKAELQSYYQKWREVAARFCIPEELVPANYTAFRQYFEKILCSTTLAVDEHTIATAQQILRTNRIVQKFVWSLAANTLPTCLSVQYGFQIDAQAQAAWQGYHACICAFASNMPLPLRISPLAILAKLKLK